MSTTLQPSTRFTVGDTVTWKGMACTVESVMLDQGEGAEFHEYFEPVYLVSWAAGRRTMVCESDLADREAA